MRERGQLRGFLLNKIMYTLGLAWSLNKCWLQTTPPNGSSSEFRQRQGYFCCPWYLRVVLRKWDQGTALVVQWLRLWASTWRGVGEWVPSLAGEVRYCMLPVAAKKVKKKKKTTPKNRLKKRNGCLEEDLTCSIENLLGLVRKFLRRVTPKWHRD